MTVGKDWTGIKSVLLTFEKVYMCAEMRSRYINEFLILPRPTNLS